MKKNEEVAREFDEQVLQHHNVTEAVEYLRANDYTDKQIDAGFKWWLDNIVGAE